MTANRRGRFGSTETSVLEQITPLILTLNEAANIGRTLGKLSWASKIIVVDSGSSDDTLEIVRRCPQAEIVRHCFIDFASQCNFGLKQVATPWVLSLDADYELSDALVSELHSLLPADCIAGYAAHFVYRIHGRPLRGTLYPPRTILHRKEGSFYRREGHGHRVVVNGSVLRLRGAIYHDDRKPLGRWLISQQRYAREEAEYLLTAGSGSLRRTDKLRLMTWPAPIGAFLYALFLKGCVLDGWPGWYYALQRAIAEALIALELIERKLSKATSTERTGTSA
jgi:glycosyltransferase involved in cell wall biosynthesis